MHIARRHHPTGRQSGGAVRASVTDAARPAYRGRLPMEEKLKFYMRRGQPLIGAPLSLRVLAALAARQSAMGAAGAVG